MKITKVSCVQFAGIRERELSFKDGLNIVYGKNESGKSTLANLISRTLFQSAKIDGRSDKDFCNLYFPSDKKDSAFTGDFADGKLSFESEGNGYTIAKEWGEGARAYLSTKDGIIQSPAAITEILKNTLRYGEGVWSDILLTSSYNVDNSLRTLLGDADTAKLKTQLAEAVTRAFVQEGGLSVDAIGNAIADKIEKLKGKHWEVEKQKPTHKPIGRWTNNVGSVLKAYYELEDARLTADTLLSFENELDRAIAVYNDKDAVMQQSKKAYDNFTEYANLLTLRSERAKNIENLKSKLSLYKKVLAEWPELERLVLQAKSLKAEKELISKREKYLSAKQLADRIEQLENTLKTVKCPEKADIDRIKKLQSEITALENRLRGMNLDLFVKTFSDVDLHIVSCRTGEKIDISDGAASICEAVKITAPGIMEMTLSPKNTDVLKIESELRDKREEASRLFEKYSATDLASLESALKLCSDTKIRLESLENQLETVLGEQNLENLEKELSDQEISVRDEDTVNSDIVSICEGMQARDFIISKQTLISGFEAEYKSIAELKASAFDLSQELEEISGTAAVDDGDIPPELVGIDNPRAHLNSLSHALELSVAERERALTDKTAAQARLESFKESIEQEPFEQVEKARRAFEEQTSLLSHWLEIEKTFESLKQSLRDNPMQDVVDSFANYLSFITAGRISPEFLSDNSIDMKIYSNDSLVDYSKLSEGTKDSVSLAFRLAVLCHLFPGGDGVIILDDPFTDMDAERTERAYTLICDIAKKHQVILLTCKQEHTAFENANVINLS